MKNPTVAKLLQKHKIRPNKKLGQNFLADLNLVEKLVENLEIYPDEDVLEIGSGLGIMSQIIAKQALEVIGVEADKRLVKIASEEFADQRNLKIVLGDFLKTDLPHLLRGHRVPLKVIGNIPYYISSNILLKLLENKNLFQFAILTLQKEVAERLMAEPGGKDYGTLAIFLQTSAIVEKLFDLPGEAFVPEPEVTSSAIKITFPKHPRHLIRQPQLYEKIVRQAFRSRRKTIKNNLKTLLKNGKISPWTVVGIDPETRPETISIEQYVTLANYLGSVL